MDFVGIEWENDTLSLALLNIEKKILKTSTLSSSEVKDVKRFYIKGNNVISSSIEASDILIKSVKLNVKKGLLLRKAFEFQKKSICEIDPNEIFSIEKYNKDKSTLKFFITTRSVLNKHLSKFKHVDIDPDIISSTAQALFRFANFYKNEKNIFIVHSGKQKTTLVLIKDGELANANSIKKNATKNEALKEIEMTLLKFAAEEISTKYFLLETGDITDENRLSSILKNDLISELLINNEMESKHLDIRKHAVSIGLALEGIINDKESLNFRFSDFASIKKVKSILKKIVSTFLFSTFMAAALCVTTKTAYEKKKATFTSKLNKLYSIEKQHLETPNIDSGKFLSDRLDQSYLTISKQSKNFPYFFDSFKVTEVINWLNDLTISKNIEVINFSYDLESYPTLDSKNSKYILKVNLEFKTSSPKEARSLHNALLEEKKVDQSKEITWDVHQDYYKSTFYMRK